MKTFLPRSLTGQMALVLAGALLLASVVNFVLLLGERQRAALIEQSGPPIARFVDIAANAFHEAPDPNDRPFGGGRGRGPTRYFIRAENIIDNGGLKRHPQLETRLRQALTDAGVVAAEIRASTRTITRPGRIADFPGGPSRGRDGQSADVRAPGDGGGPDVPRGNGPSPTREAREIILAAQLPDGRWLTSTTFAPEATQDDVFLLVASTVVIFFCVLAAAMWIAGRLSRPLRDLASAAARVGEADEPQQVVARGPGDVQQTIAAFNAMSLRVSQLLREKDVMLGALGHDLRTPLASLRIRLETMEPEAERVKAIRTIEETSELLEDILELSRHGKSREPERTVDISVVVEDMVEDYAETGAPVALTTAQRAVAVCRPVLLRRALRNLIDNAVTYGGAARVSVERSDARLQVHVDDDGPGMSEEALAAAKDPFFRGEDSRNKATGGVGLGLTLAEAIVRAHGGDLVLANRSPHGLRATVALPLSTPHASSARNRPSAP